MCDVLINEKQELIKKRKAVEHTCDVCQKTFSRKARLTKHVNSVHFGMKNYACEHCEKRFAQKITLAYHVNSVHFV